MSSPGVSVRYPGELTASPGFWAVPRVRRVLPPDLMRFPLRMHGGERWRGTRVFAAVDPWRVDQALSDDGRIVAIAYGPPGAAGAIPIEHRVIGRVYHADLRAAELTEADTEVPIPSTVRGVIVVGRLA